MLDLSRTWYRDSLSLLAILLLPFSWLFGFISLLRRWCYQFGIFKVFAFPVPVIVVGNITVGGTGKTPFTIWLANYLIQQGLRPGIVSRGYGGKPQSQPLLVGVDANAADVGDEALLLARNAHVPVYVCVDRVKAVEALLANNHCNIVLADDGLQHYRLGRDIEIALIDGARQFGNHCLLPAGPLREPISRLNKVDIVIKNDGDPQNKWGMMILPQKMIALKSNEQIAFAQFNPKKIHAVAGIGNPQRFFAMLAQSGYEIIPHVFSDHYHYTANDFTFNDDLPIVMTEKDAVKCQSFADGRFWYVSVTTKIGEAVQEALLLRLTTLRGVQ